MLAIDLELERGPDEPRAANEARRRLVLEGSLRELAIQRVVPDAIDSLGLPRLDQADAYGAEPRLGVELLRGGLPEELRSASFPGGAGEEASDSQPGTLRRLGIETVRHRVVQVAASWCSAELRGRY